MADIFGQVGAPRWNDPDEDRLRYRQLGHQSGQLFAQGFMSAYDQAREEKYRDEQIDKIKSEVVPVVQGLQGVSNYDQMMDKIIEHPEWMLNPRTSPMVSQMMKNWEAAEAIKARAENSQIAKEWFSKNLEWESKFNSAPPDIQGKILQSGGAFTVDQSTGRKYPNPLATGIFNTWAMSPQGTIQPFGLGTDEAKMRQLREKNQAQMAVTEKRGEQAMDRAKFHEESRDTRFQDAIKSRSELQEDRQAFEREMLGVRYDQQQKMLESRSKMLSRLQKERYDMVKEGKLPSGMDEQIKAAAKNFTKAKEYAIANPNDDGLQKQAFRAELDFLYLLRERDRQNAEKARSAEEWDTPPTDDFEQQTPSTAPRKRRYNPDTGEFEEIE